MNYHKNRLALCVNRVTYCLINIIFPHSILHTIVWLTCFSDFSSCRVFAIWSSSFCRFSSSCLESARCWRRSLDRRRQSRFCRVSDVELCSADEFKSEMHTMEWRLFGVGMINSTCALWAHVGFLAYFLFISRWSSHHFDLHARIKLIVAPPAGEIIWIVVKWDNGTI